MSLPPPARPSPAPGTLGILSLARVAERLAAYERRTQPVGRLRPAAVLVPFVEHPDGLRLLFTVRPKDLPSHAGQVAFPGGRVDPGDDDRWATALRESHEELGIPPDRVQRLGAIDDYRTITHYHVTPCVGVVQPDVALRPAPGEVERAFDVPLAHLADPASRRTMTLRHRLGQRRLTFYLFGSEVIWGATAAMLENLLDVLGRPPTAS